MSILVARARNIDICREELAGRPLEVAAMSGIDSCPRGRTAGTHGVCVISPRTLGSDAPSSTASGNELAPRKGPQGCPRSDARGREAGSGPMRAAKGPEPVAIHSEGEPAGAGPALDTRGPASTVGCGSSPPPSARMMVDKMPVRKRPVKTKPTRPEQDVRKLQTNVSEADFLRDLDRASTDRSAEKLAGASRRDPASPKT
jgi:hypothetical protein